MFQRTLHYYDQDQQLASEFYAPDDKKPYPGVLVFPAFEGLAPFTQDYAKKLTSLGYATLAVDMYGDAKTADTLPDCFALLTPFLQDRQLVRQRALLAFKALQQQPQVITTHIAAVGFCFGGMCVLELARSGAALKAGVSMHGVLAKSPLTTHHFDTKLLILHGFKDKQIPPQALFSFAEEMHAIGVEDWTFTFFGDAMHSFTDPRTGTFDPQKELEMSRAYNQTVAARTFTYTREFLQEWLLN